MILSFFRNGKSNTILYKLHDLHGNLLKNLATLKQNKIISKHLYEMFCKINEDFIRWHVNE